MKITAEIFDAYLKCQTKCWLRAKDEPFDGNTYSEWVKARNESYRTIQTERLIAELSDDQVARSPARETLMVAKWRLATCPIARTRNLETSSHAVEHIPSKGRGQSAQFIPIRYVFANKLTRDDKLLLAFDALVLSAMLGRKVDVGKIIHGDHQATLKMKPSSLTHEVLKLIGKIATLLSDTSPPDLVLNRLCAECEYQARCRHKAIEKDDLSLLSSMTEKERKRLNSKGIFTVTQLSYAFRPRRRAKSTSDKQEKYHHALKALSIRENKIHVVGNAGADESASMAAVTTGRDIQGLDG